MTKTHAEYVQEVVSGLTEVHCGAPDCTLSMPIDAASHVDLRQIKSLGAWSTTTVATIEEAKGYFCEEHQRLLKKGCPGIEFRPLERTIQVLAQHRRVAAVKAEDAAVAEALRQQQIKAEQAKIQTMADFARGLFDPEAGPKEVRASVNGGCRAQVLDAHRGRQIKLRVAS